jgi:hypothetical protein
MTDVGYQSRSKLGPIPPEHFENDPAPPGTYAGLWSVAAELRDAITELIRLSRVVIETRPARRRARQGLAHERSYRNTRARIFGHVRFM